MELYYFLNNWIEGPVDQEELRKLIDESEITEHSPAWSPAYSKWISASELAGASDETSLIEFEDLSAMATQNLATELSRENLPQPADMLALRLAYEQELITGSQCERCLKELLETPNAGVSLLQKLHDNGWITASQQSSIEDVLNLKTNIEHIPGYETIRELGCGGMGTTYLARQLSMDRIVALKVLLPKLSKDREYVRRFEREAKMAAKLNHINIATAYEVKSDAGRHYISMEYIEGKTLAQRLDTGREFSNKDAADIIIQVCRALEHAHQHNLIHRDITPKNIILRPDGVVKLIDMGLARSTDPSSSGLTAVGTTVGTPSYMSPEQCLGKDNLDIRSDIYSLGCVFFEILTAEPPLTGSTMFETISRHINEDVPYIKDIKKDAGDLFSHIVQKMTARETADRYQTPQQVIDGFQTDSDTIRLAQASFTALLPVHQQLEKWQDNAAVEIRLQTDWREYVHLVAKKLEEKLEKAGADPEFQGYVHTIFAELIANAFDHGCKEIKNGIIRIRIEFNDAFFRLEVDDPGPGFAANEMLEKIKKEPLNRERRRGIMQILNIADVFEFSQKGNRVKAILYCKVAGSGVFVKKTEGITYVEIKGKGDLALAESFRRWVTDYNSCKNEKVCLMVRTEWVSSMFVGTIGKLDTKLKETGANLSVWPEQRSCYRIMQQLGISSFVHVYDSLEQAVFALRYAKNNDNNEDAGNAETEPVETEKNKVKPKSKSKVVATKAEKSGKRKNSRQNDKPNGRKRNNHKTKGFIAWLKDLF